MPATPCAAWAATQRLRAHRRGIERLPASRQFAYALGQLGWSSLSGLVSIQLVYFYIPPLDPASGETVFPIFVTQDSFAVILNVITLLATAGRLWDAVTDPLIASWSDRLRHSRGRRIPCLAIGTLPAALFCALLFVPVVPERSGWNIAWLALMQTLFYLFLTVYCTPYFALIPELGHTAQERLNLSTWIAITFALGTIVGSSAPAIGGLFGLDALLGLQVGVGVVCVLAAVCMAVPVLAISERRYCAAEPSAEPFWSSLKACARNKYFRPYCAADFAFFFANSLIATGMPYYLTVLLRLPLEALTPVLGGIVAVSFACYLPVNRLVKCVPKKRIVIAALALLAIVLALIFFLGWPGAESVPPVAQIAVVAALAAVPLAVLGVLPNACLADVAVHHGLRTGQKVEGMYFAARTLLQKLGVSVGIMVFASLTNFGKDVGDDLGVRVSGLVGDACALLALAAFCCYDERTLLKEIDTMTEAAEASGPAVEVAPRSPSCTGRVPPL